MSAHSAGAYTATLLVMVDVKKGVGVHPTPSPARANFILTTECTPESSGCNSVYSVITTSRDQFVTFPIPLIAPYPLPSVFYPILLVLSRPISVPYRTRSLYSGTELVPTSAFFSFWYQMRSGILQTCTKEGSSVWIAAQLRGCSIA